LNNNLPRDACDNGFIRLVSGRFFKKGTPVKGTLILMLLLSIKTHVAIARVPLGHLLDLLGHFCAVVGLSCLPVAFSVPIQANPVQANQELIVPLSYAPTSLAIMDEIEDMYRVRLQKVRARFGRFGADELRLPLQRNRIGVFVPSVNSSVLRSKDNAKRFLNYMDSHPEITTVVLVTNNKSMTYLPSEALPKLLKVEDTSSVDPYSDHRDGNVLVWLSEKLREAGKEVIYWPEWGAGTRVAFGVRSARDPSRFPGFVRNRYLGRVGPDPLNWAMLVHKGLYQAYQQPGYPQELLMRLKGGGYLDIDRYDMIWGHLNIIKPSVREGFMDYIEEHIAASPDAIMLDDHFFVLIRLLEEGKLDELQIIADFSGKPVSSLSALSPIQRRRLASGILQTVLAELLMDIATRLQASEGVKLMISTAGQADLVGKVIGQWTGGTIVPQRYHHKTWTGFTRHMKRQLHRNWKQVCSRQVATAYDHRVAPVLRVAAFFDTLCGQKPFQIFQFSLPDSEWSSYGGRRP
jgi:hypothetical protein